MVEDAVASSEASMKQWVNETLAADYYDIATIEGKITALEAMLSDGDEALKEELESLSSALDQARAEMTEAYEAAIREAIEEHAGMIEGRIKSEVDAVIAELGVNALVERLDSIEARLSSVEEQIDKVLSMIQAVAYVPEHPSGAVYVDAAEKSAEMCFKMSPSSVIDDLEKVWSEAMSVRYVETAVTRSVPVLNDLTITSAVFDRESGTVSITVDCQSLEDSFFDGTTSASAALFIANESNNISSDFINLAPYFDIGDELSYTDDIKSLSLETTITTAIVSGTITKSFGAFKIGGTEVGVLYSLDPDFSVETLFTNGIAAMPR